MDKSKKYKNHTGKWEYHDDDCWCVMGGRYCNRGGGIWSCCGAIVKDSECSAPDMHPTYMDHPLYDKTFKYVDGKRVSLNKDEIRKLSPKSFE